MSAANKRTYEVTGMHCQSCVGKLTAAMSEFPGIVKATVTLVPPQAVLELSSQVSTRVLNDALQSVGNFRCRERLSVLPSQISEVAIASIPRQSLTPLFIIAGYILGGVSIRALSTNDFSIHSAMANFMGGFFVIFSLFKMINLPGFAKSYATYDVVARRSRSYAFAYPFIELALGILYFTAVAPIITNIATALLMFVGAIGVVQALRTKQEIQCACLGTALNLPMTKVTLAENALMGVMAFFMLAV